MPPTTNTQPVSGSGSGEEWLENIRCPTYFDFEAAVAYPCTLGDVNPPLLESVYDSDDETRGFFRSLYEDPSLHRTLHRRSLSPQRNRLQNMGKPLYHHRPQTTFAEYLAEFQRKQAQGTDGTVQESTASSSKTDASPARGLSLPAISNSDHTPSPTPQNVNRGTRSDAWIPQVCKDEKSVPLRRPRRSPASSVSVELEQKATQEQPRPRAQPNPARRKPRPPERSVPQAKCLRATQNDRLSKPEFRVSKETSKPELEGSVMRTRSANNSGSYEKDGSSLNWSSAARSEFTRSANDFEADATDNNTFSVDLDLVKIMEEHNERLRKSKSERGAGSSSSARTESGTAKDVAYPSAAEATSQVSRSEARNGDTKRPDLSENGTQGSKVDSEDNSIFQTAKSSSFRRNSLSHLLQMENERVLEERKRRLPERRKALQQNRRNALRNVRSSGVGERRINPISAQIDFTSAETKKPLRASNDTEQSSTIAANEQKPLSDSTLGRDRERGLRGYRSRMEASRSIPSSSGLTDKGCRAKTTNSCRAGCPKINIDNLPSRTDMKGGESHSTALGETEETPTHTSISREDVSDDLNLLLTEHNNKIRRNRTIIGAINI